MPEMKRDWKDYKYIEFPNHWEKYPEHVTEEETNKLLETAKQLDVENSAIYEERKTAKNEIASLIIVAWGNSIRRDNEGQRITQYITKQYITRPSSNVSRVKDFITKKQHLVEEKQKAVQEKTRQEKQARIIRENTYTVMMLATKYGHEEPAFVDPEDVLELLRQQNKYLDLALAMNDTRNDWSDGFYRVSGAMRRFKCDTPQDYAIIEDLETCFHDDICDGRIFRDTEWNYNRIYELIDPHELLEDAQTLNELISRW